MERVQVPFEGTILDAVQDGEDVWVSVERACAALNLDPAVQRVSLLASPWARTGFVLFPDPRGRLRDTFVVDLPTLALWRQALSIPRTAASGNLRVYFIRCQVTGLIKIGITHNLQKRLRALALASPTPLELLGQFAVASAATEREIHQRFAPFRAHGEWFEDAPELQAFIRAATASEVKHNERRGAPRSSRRVAQRGR